MYNDEDLEYGVEKGIFTEKAITEFRQLIKKTNPSFHVDEENFKLFRSFNDIFVVIACALLLSSLMGVGFVLKVPALGAIISAVATWLLAEIFVKKRRMALPAICLMFAFICFVGGIFASVIDGAFSPYAMMIASVFYWWRFRVPLTIAVITAHSWLLLFTMVASLLQFVDVHTQVIIIPFAFIAGICTFVFAMWWDMQDKQRIHYQSDVAFWLHAMSAPMIIHSIVLSLDVFEGKTVMIFSAILIIVVYIIMGLISIIINRRALMVSGLGYLIYVVYSLLNQYGDVGVSLVITGLFIGASLLVLSYFWQGIRCAVVAKLPNSIKTKIPSLSTE